MLMVSPAAAAFTAACTVRYWALPSAATVRVVPLALLAVEVLASAKSGTAAAPAMAARTPPPAIRRRVARERRCGCLGARLCCDTGSALRTVGYGAGGSALTPSSGPVDRKGCSG